ncbi:hypothetical protein DPMN_093284 [Dreissena polymorpha]|uniref:Uncharacterized protein n=1 Tax=Dreissena polymorpha TaxID=45954 RepID=A0A9D4L5F4_DREPO|nr:hypothetical protein DPMN_093284 [Dreissena polymorpha]
MLTPHNTHSTTAKRRSKKLTISTLCSVLREVSSSVLSYGFILIEQETSKKPSSSAVGDDSSCRDGLCFFCTP